MKKSVGDEHVLEQNVGTLLEAGGEAPRLADTARARIRTNLVDKFGTERKRSPLVAIGFGLAATAAGALIVTRIAGGPAEQTQTEGAVDGATWIADTDGKVTKLGARHLRVEGAALIDVEPGHGAFTVETARGTIEVIGTRFLVDAAKDKTTAAVVRGQVKLASEAGSVLLHAGEQGVLEQGRPPTRMPAPRLSHLVSFAEQVRKKQEQTKPVRNGTLFAREPNNPWVPETPLPIVKLGVDVVVEDQVARVAIDQTFHNPNNRAMEGMYRFAIPPDASLQRLAMYVDGKLTESAVVERMQARRIYEDVVYRRLDPALLEWAGTGRLSLKVYPLPADQDKRLLIAYTQSLPKLYDDYTLTVPLPEVDLPVGELTFDVKMKGCANCELSSTSHKITVDRAGDDAVVHYTRTKVELGDSLVLHVRDTRKHAIVASDTVGTDQYWLVRARPQLTAPAREYRKKTWVILDDVSASRDATSRRAQMAMIDGFLRELDEDDKVAVIAFDVAARTKLAPTRVLDVDRKAVRAALAEEGDIGATDFGVALDAALKTLAGVDPDDANIVYLGDGIISSGPRQLDKLRDRIAGKAHFIGVGIGDGPDTQTLDALAAATGGYATTIDLADDVGWRSFDLVAALHTPRVAGLTGKLVGNSGELVPGTVYIKTPQLADGEELELVAKLVSPSTAPVAVELAGTLNGKPWTQRVALSGSPKGDTRPTTDAGYLPRLWAQRHIAARLLAKHEPVQVPPCTATVVVAAQRTTRAPAKPAEPVCKTEGEVREERDEAIRKDIVELGKQYFLLSRHTSLLVLENDEMYKKYKVTKGAGDTWAPYKVPDKIPVVTTPTVAPDVAKDAELVRRPLQILYNAGYYDPTFTSLGTIGGGWAGETWGGRGHGSGGGGFVTTRQQAIEKAKDAGVLAFRNAGPTESKPDKSGGDFDEARKLVLEEGQAGQPDAPAAEDIDGEAHTADANKQRTIVFADEVGGLGNREALDRRASGRFGVVAVSKSAKAAPSMYSRPIVPLRLGYPTDVTYDDLTAFVPAFVPDASDGWRGELTASAAGAKTHAIDDASKAILAAARDAVPTGMYRWGELEIAVDSAHRFGWKRTTGSDLAETASFDGKSLVRRYAELGIDVTRPITDDDVALGFGYLPLWIAEPAHYARWFEVRAQGANEVGLYRMVVRGPGKPKPELAYVLAFDSQHHLTAIRDGKGSDLVKVTWGAIGPTSARVGGEDIQLGFSGLPITDVVTWAHGSSNPGVAVELPMHLPAYWDGKLAALTEGSAEWRHTQRQKMASLAAVNDREKLFKTFDALRAHGGVELGDLALASAGLAGGTTDVQLAQALDKVKDQPIAQYIQASRSYAQVAKAERMKAKTSAGFIGALWTLREVTALYVADKDTEAVDRILSLGERAPELRLAAVGMTQNRYRMKPADIVRAWDSIAKGQYKNVARAQAAQLLASRSQYDAAVERIASLVDDYALDAYPPALQQMQYWFSYSRRGSAGMQLVWSRLRDKVLAKGDWQHVVNLLPLATSHPLDQQAILARAAKLAADDPDRVMYVAQMAISYGQQGFGASLLEPLVKKHPTRELLQLMASLAVQQGRQADALAHLEAAQELGGDEEVSLSTLRAELTQIISIARQLAVSSQGADRTRAVQKALAWGKRWRALDPGNSQIDQQMGELLLAVGDTSEAWRQLSSVIERDPMSGDGYQTVAQAFETQGRVAEAVPYWHQAVIIDQTNPTPRMREAQALIALGKTADGDKILEDIVARKWHVRWDGVVYQVKSMLERAKRGTGGAQIFDEE